MGCTAGYIKKVDTVCKCHGINYYGWYGTLLGAIRHKGFIPWDDDIDLAMLRDDYEQFRCHIKQALPKGWEVSEHEPTMISIFNSDTVHLDQDFLDRFHGCPFKNRDRYLLSGPHSLQQGGRRITVKSVLGSLLPMHPLESSRRR